MKYAIIKKLLNTLLIIALVIQPVMLSYAMASMDHGHHGMQMSHDMGDHHVMQMADSGSDDNGVMLDDCCKTPACSPAVTTTLLMLQHVAVAHHELSFNVSMTSIDLPSEIKPPRR